MAKDIISLDASDKERACTLMVATAMNQLVLRHTSPGLADDANLLRWLNAGILTYGMRYGRVLTTPDVKGLAIWFGPGETKFGIWKMIHSGLGAAPIKLGLGAMNRLFGLMQVAGLVHREAAPGAHWYLYNITVDPVHRGQGIARALMETVLEEADKAGLPAFLESRNADTIGFYEKLGFKVIRKVEAGRSSFWPMIRIPASRE